MDREDMLNLARWFEADGGTLAEFIDALERPDRWVAEIDAARLIASLGDLGMDDVELGRLHDDGEPL